MARRRKDVSYYEKLLAREGLAPLDVESCPNDDDLALSPILKRGTRKDASDAGRSTAIHTWLAWAADVVATFPFRGVRERRVWEMLAEGKSRAQIARRLGCTVHAVRHAISAVSRLIPPPPVPNPWHRGGENSKQYRQPRDSDVTSLADLVTEDPVTAAEMLGAATKYIADLGDEYMDAFREQLGIESADDVVYDYAPEWEQPREIEQVRFPSDWTPEASLHGPARSLSRAEIAKLNLTPPRQRKDPK